MTVTIHPEILDGDLQAVQHAGVDEAYAGTLVEHEAAVEVLVPQLPRRRS